MIAPYQVFAARGGELMIAAANDGLYVRLCAVLDAADIARDARFSTNPDRLERRDELARLIGARVAEHDVDDLLARLQAAGVPAARVNDVGEAVAHPQTAALGLVQEMPEPTLALPLSIDGERVTHRAPPPRLGEHSEQILRDLGYDDGSIAELAASGVIRLG